MIELKTLKDLTLGWVDYTPLGSIFVDIKKIREELKQEAIKYIKMFETECNSEIDKSRPCAYCRGARDWFIRFFNITEEDLK